MNWEFCWFCCHHQYAGQPAADAFRNQLDKTGLIPIFIIRIKGYPTDMDHLISPEGMGRKTTTSKPVELDCRNRSWTWFWEN